MKLAWLALLVPAGCYVMPDAAPADTCDACAADGGETPQGASAAQAPVNDTSDFDGGATTTCVGWDPALAPRAPGAAGAFVATGVEQRSAVSPDGVHWSVRESTAPAPDAGDPRWDLQGHVVAENLHVAAATSGIMTSIDGVTWTAQTLPEVKKYVSYHDGFYAVAYGKGRFVTAASPSNNPAAFYHSEDGVTWDAPTVSSDSVHSLGIRALAFADDKFVAVGEGRRTVTSDDGKTWHDDHQNGNVREVYTALAFGNGVWVAVGHVVPPSSGIGVGAPALFTWSNDGKTWHDASKLEIVGIFANLAFDGHRFVTCARLGCWASETGQEWTQLPGDIGDPRPTVALTHAGGVFVGLDAPATLMTSSDGSRWTPVFCGEAPALTALTFAP